MTVPEAAQLLERNPKTVRRRIREGKVLAKKLGSQHFLEPADLVRYAVAKSTTLPLPRAWQRTRSGASMPDMTVPVWRMRARRERVNSALLRRSPLWLVT